MVRPIDQAAEARSRVPMSSRWASGLVLWALGAAACGGSGLDGRFDARDLDAVDGDTMDDLDADTRDADRDLDAEDGDDVEVPSDGEEVLGDAGEVEDLEDVDAADVAEVAEVEDVEDVDAVDAVEIEDTADAIEDLVDEVLADVDDVENLGDADDADAATSDGVDAGDVADASDAGTDTSGPVPSVCGPVTTVEDARYADLVGLTGAGLRAMLRDRIDDGIGLTYDAARDLMYVTARIDVDAADLVHCIYTGTEVPADGTRSPGVITTEHSWPRSDGAATFPAEGDIHHLFPATDTANGRRGNDEFGEVSCGMACPWDQGGSFSGPSVDGRARVFEVRPESRGDIARAHFYFAVRYDLPIPPLEEATLRAWHCDDPVDDVERRRNDAIFTWQLNRNPFVDQPQLVERVLDY